MCVVLEPHAFLAVLNDRQPTFPDDGMWAACPAKPTPLPRNLPNLGLSVRTKPQTSVQIRHLQDVNNGGLPLSS